MKKNICLIFTLTILGFNIQAQNITLPSDSASIVFTNLIQSNNMSLVVNNDVNAEAYTVSANINGTPCRKIPAGKFMYITCNRSFIPTSQTNLLIAITYYANSNNNIWFNYNSIVNNYQGADFSKTKTNQWVTTIVAITDAALKGVMNSGGDFRLGFNAEDNYIKQIIVYKGVLDPSSQSIPSKPDSTISAFRNKSFAGYQIWHKAGTTNTDWIHWSYGVLPAAGFLTNENIASFPDISEYPDSVLYTTNFANLGNGKATKLYNDADATIINRQMNWLQKAGLDGVAIQRFVGPIGKTITITPTSHLSNVKNACEATGRLFYICYDLNGTDASIVQRIRMDWVYEIEQMRALTTSPNYATVNGKPVVEIWGVGYDIGATKQQCIDMIHFLQSRGCYVIGGVPRGWRTNSEGALPDFTEVYNTLDAISPWTVGVYNDINGANNYLSEKMIADKSYCDQNGKDYLPVVFPGSGNWLSANGSFSQTDRAGGNLLWQQVLNAKSIGLTSVYYAMLDEFEESTNLINGAVDYFDIPTDQYFETFAKDGVWTSSNYYLRLAATASKMLRGDVPVTTTIPLAYSLGPIYYRNSAESRTTVYNMNGATATKTLKIDPCFYNPAVFTSTNVTNPSVAIVNEPAFAKSGIYSIKINGTSNSIVSSKYFYKIADVKIPVKNNMQLSFWKYSINTLGQYTSVDLLFKSGKTLHSLISYKDNNGNALTPAFPRGTIGSWQKFTCQIGKGELIDDTITGLLIAYDNPVSGSNFTAYFDDIIIEDVIDTISLSASYGNSPWPIPGKIEAEDYNYGGEGIAYHDYNSTNDGGQYRITEGVDIESCGEGGYNVGYTNDNEWMDYAVNVLVPGTYNLQIRYASPSSDSRIHIELNGINISGSLTLSGTGNWQVYQTANVTTPLLTTGKQIMRIVFEKGNSNINFVNFNLINWISCPNSNTVLIAGNFKTGDTYQWQINTGSGFTDLTNNLLYSGVNTDTLTLQNASSSMYGNLYRCRINNNTSGITYSTPYLLRFIETWTGAAGTPLWETAGNWSCNTVPDENTDVIINSGNVILNSTTTVRSFYVSDGAIFNIKSGHKLTIK
ncbi:carbohydrate-binding protein [Ferruginibacter lapsinanis]|uniref:carbohydrate-binding protein n=1 Tax=Ferruginibacter lapsinanis TaxID=563172 RepID=UPI001E576ABF|nr:carbohydrate-binding protein [Ferruginibacter lapsinanis]UEG49096.1 carbohydrate-binding protein [Ferruginibacter lapsinanis]